MRNDTSAEELRALVAGLHARRPDEVMGEAASSSLVGSTVTAALFGGGVLLGLTVLVFLLGGGPPEPTKPAIAAAPAVQPQPVESTDVGQRTTELGDATRPSGEDAASAVEAMGIGDTKDPDTAADGLENRLDQLLDGLE